MLDVRVQPRRLARRPPSASPATGLGHDALLSAVDASAAGGPRRRLFAQRGERDALRQPRVRVGVVRDRHRVHEVLLESRLDGGLDLLDRPDDALDLLAAHPGRASAIRAPVPAAFPAEVTASGLAVRDEPEDEGVDRVDVRAERAGEPDPVDPVDAVALHQQAAAGVERRLGQLDLPDVVLGDRGAPAPVPEDVRERPPVRHDAAASAPRARRRSCRRS